jgi:hypothetical protein
LPKYRISYLDAAKEEHFDALLYYKERSINAAVAFESAIETLEGHHMPKKFDCFVCQKVQLLELGSQNIINSLAFQYLGYFIVKFQ